MFNLLKLFDFLSRFKFGKDTPHGNGDSYCDNLPSEWKQLWRYWPIKYWNILASQSQNDFFSCINQVHLSHTRSILVRSLSILHVVGYLSNPVTLQLHLHLLATDHPQEKSLLFQLPGVVGLSQLYQKRRKNLPHLRHSLHLLILYCIIFQNLMHSHPKSLMVLSINSLLVVKPLELCGKFSLLLRVLLSCSFLL